MALIQFSCIATGPFITFKETAERIFEALGEPFHEHGAFAQHSLPWRALLQQRGMPPLIGLIGLTASPLFCCCRRP